MDYGEEHAREMGHGRWGRLYSVGLYPSWSGEHPLHLLGHSMVSWAFVCEVENPGFGGLMFGIFSGRCYDCEDDYDDQGRVLWPRCPS